MSAQQVATYVIAGRRRPGEPRVEAPVLPAPPLPLQRCQWTLEGDEFHTWCGFAFIDDGESDPRNFWWCPYCGGPLRVVTVR